MTPKDGEDDPAAGPPSPESGVAAGRRARESVREIAVDLYGGARVEAEWTADGWMRSRQRLALRRMKDAGPPGDGTGPRPTARR